MGTTTTNMGLSKPTLAGDAATWDDQLNATIDAIDTHNHTTGAGVQIPAGGLNLTTDLTLNGTCALINTKALAFTTQASYTVSKSLWVKTSDGELYWRNASGTDVKMTSGGTLNVAIVGGIVGDYAAAGAAVYYDDSAQAYRFLEAAPTPNSWSRVQCGDLDLYEHASGIANRVRISSPTGLAASYALTLPAALPASTSIMQVSSAGAISTTRTPTLDSLTIAAGGHVTVSSTGRYKHGDEELNIHAAAFQSENSSVLYNQNGYQTSAGASAVIVAPVMIPVGRQVKTIIVYYNVNGTGVGIQPRFRRQDWSTGTQSDVTAGTSDNTGSAIEGQTLTVNHTIASGYGYFIEVTVTSASHRVHGAKVTYDFP